MRKLPAIERENPLLHPFEYSFGPFLFKSFLEIAELRDIDGDGQLSVTIDLDEVPEELEDAAPFGALCRVKPLEYLLTIPGVARYLVTDGNRIRVQIDPAAPRPDVSGYLLGSCFGALCHQNGLLPLHASTIEIGGRVTAFLGDSGAGKSTLAACLQDRGHRILSDDICVLAPEGEAMWVIPVAGWLKLWRQSFDHLGATPEEENRVFREDDKFRVYLDPAVREQPARERPALANLVFLTRAQTKEEIPRIETLTTSETIASMMRLTYLGYITELTGSHARVFQQCARVLAGAKGYRLVVPWGLERMDAVLDLLETELTDGVRLGPTEG